MSTIRKIIDIDASADDVWDVIRDVGAVHARLAPGFVIDTKLEPGARVVKFANGVVVRELIVGLDPTLRRLSYAAVGEAFAHHSASFEVASVSANSCKLIWTSDFLPDDAASRMRPLIEQGSLVIQRTLNKVRD